MIIIRNIHKPVSCQECPFWLNTFMCDHEYMMCPISEVEDTSIYKCKSTVKDNLGHEFQVTIKPDGENELDPCDYELVDKRDNCVVEVMRCKKCGHEEIWWTDKDRHPECLDDDE